MTKRDLASEMRGRAEAAVEMVHEELGWELDYSEQSLGTIEALLDSFAKEADTSPELIDNVALLYGSYIGEIIRRHFPRAEWMRSESAPGGMEAPYVLIDGIQLFPITWCYKRLCNGPADSIVDKYLAFREALSGRLPRASARTSGSVGALGG